MSSAILYLAIIAIWAGVLIPRWLRRDTSRAVPADGPAADLQAPEDAREGDDEGDDERLGDGRPGGPAPVAREESRRRVLAARRRLLWMMLSLEAAGVGLAVTGLAAWWVTAPPTVMLAGYLLLLHEAAAADAERADAERAAIAAEREAARRRAGRARERAETRQAGGAARHAFAAAPVAADYEDLGRARDFTPGLRYGTSPDTADDTAAYDQYTENRLRAVGD
jgi:hypothetical protein